MFHSDENLKNYRYIKQNCSPYIVQKKKILNYIMSLYLMYIVYTHTHTYTKYSIYIGTQISSYKYTKLSKAYNENTIING